MKTSKYNSIAILALGILTVLTILHIIYQNQKLKSVELTNIKIAAINQVPSNLIAFENKELNSVKKININHWAYFCNEKYDYCFNYPADTFEKIKQTDYSFVAIKDLDTRTVIRAWEDENINNKSIKAKYYGVLNFYNFEGKGNLILSKQLSEDAFMIKLSKASGTIIQEKTILRDGKFYICMVEYPADEADTFDYLAQEILNSFYISEI